MVRCVRVASISFKGAGRKDSIEDTVNANISEMEKLLDKALLDNPDIICFPEIAPTIGLNIRESIIIAYKMGNNILERFREKAAKNNVYIVLPMIIIDDGYPYNASILIGRDGSIVGSYYKVHPTINEIESGIVPGDKYNVFDTDFGKIGFAICFDLNFKDVIEGLKTKDVELVFFSSMYPGGKQIISWALDYGIYIVSSIGGEGNSVIVDPLGRLLLESSRYSPIICKTINLDYEILHLDYNFSKLEKIKEKYGNLIEIEVSRPEAIFMMTSYLKEKTVKDIIREFGLETRKEYFARANRVRMNMLRKKGIYSKIK